MRFELLDKTGISIGESVRIVDDGFIDWEAPQRIKRAGTIQIDPQLFTLTDEYKTEE